MTKKTELLNTDGQVYYFPQFFDLVQSDSYAAMLSEKLHWQSDTVKIFGKTIETKRQMAWYGSEHFDYRYSGISHIARLWESTLQEIRDRIHKDTGYDFNSCLANKYASGEESMGWHSDDEPVMDSKYPIASVSLGASRRFLLRHKMSGEKEEILLTNGSLLLMMPPTQQFWQHSLPKMTTVKTQRINLTFRNFIPIR
jgi:alkylated DNA repair dioxygenase AlkB